MNIFDIVVVQPIFNLLIAIYSVMPYRDLGLALIVFTIIVRVLMYPLLRSQLHQSRLINKLKPHIVKIKERSNGDKQAEALQMMELYKKHDVKPFRSIGVLLIQLPILFGLFYAVRIFIDHKDKLSYYTYNFLESFGPIQEIATHPERLKSTMLGVFNINHPALFSGGIDTALLALALLCAYLQMVSMKQTMPKNESKKGFRDILKQAGETGKEPDQSEVNAVMMAKMMKFMPIMMGFVMLTLPGALVWYYTLSTGIGVLQQKMILDQDIEEMEDLADEVIESKQQKKADKREKNAKEATITRIVAKDSRPRNKKGV